MSEGGAENRSRRGLLKGLALAVWASLVGAAGLSLGAVLHMTSAVAGSDKLPPVDLGPVGDFAAGSVLVRDKVALCRDEKGFFALLLVCPHLGCQPAWQKTDQRFVCPCHRSIFAADGSLISGPAGKGLAHAFLELDPQGRLKAHPSRPVDPAFRLKPA